MYKDKKILAVIPARSGSKGIKNKNIKIINGKPLIFYTIKECLKSNYIDESYVSSDSEKIINIATEYKIKTLKRPKKLAGDKTRNFKVLKHIITEQEKLDKYYDFIILLQPTSPLRTLKDIDKSIEKIIKTNSDTLVSITKSHFSPGLLLTINNKKESINFNNKSYSRNIQRQQVNDYYYPNGAIFIHKTELIKKTKSYPLLPNKKNTYYIMPKSKSFEIDTKDDLKLIKKIIK